MVVVEVVVVFEVFVGAGVVVVTVVVGVVVVVEVEEVVVEMGSVQPGLMMQVARQIPTFLEELLFPSVAASRKHTKLKKR